MKADSDDLTVENNPCDTNPAQMSSETEIATCEPGAGKSESRTDLVVAEANQDDNSHVTDEAVDEITEHVARCNIDEKVSFFYERRFSISNCAGPGSGKKVFNASMVTFYFFLHVNMYNYLPLTNLNNLIFFLALFHGGSITKV